MPGDVADGAREFRDLAVVLRLVGQDGLRRELFKAISGAAKPLADEIKSTAHLDPYLPNRYAGVLSASLRVGTLKRTGQDPGVTIRAMAPTFGRGGRKVAKLNDGVLSHPVFGDRKDWKTQAVRPGFFTDACEAAGPRVREAILAAMARVAEEATKGA